MAKDEFKAYIVWRATEKDPRFFPVDVAPSGSLAEVMARNILATDRTFKVSISGPHLQDGSK